MVKEDPTKKLREKIERRRILTNDEKNFLDSFIKKQIIKGYLTIALGIILTPLLKYYLDTYGPLLMFFFISMMLAGFFQCMHGISVRSVLNEYRVKIALSVNTPAQKVSLENSKSKVSQSARVTKNISMVTNMKDAEAKIRDLELSHQQLAGSVSEAMQQGYHDVYEGTQSWWGNRNLHKLLKRRTEGFKDLKLVQTEISNYLAQVNITLDGMKEFYKKTGQTHLLPFLDRQREAFELAKLDADIAEQQARKAEAERRRRGAEKKEKEPEPEPVVDLVKQHEEAEKIRIDKDIITLEQQQRYEDAKKRLQKQKSQWIEQERANIRKDLYPEGRWQSEAWWREDVGQKYREQADEIFEQYDLLKMNLMEAR